MFDCILEVLRCAHTHDKLILFHVCKLGKKLLFEGCHELELLNISYLTHSHQAFEHQIGTVFSYVLCQNKTFLGPYSVFLALPSGAVGAICQHLYQHLYRISFFSRFSILFKLNVETRSRFLRVNRLYHLQVSSTYHLFNLV